MPVWWVTGATGFLGGHVLTRLARMNDQRREWDATDRIVALVRENPPPEKWTDTVEFGRLEMGDSEEFRDVAQQAPPDYVIHCAGRTPPASEEDLRRANFDLTANLLAGLYPLGRAVRLVLAGSAAELGPVGAADLPVGEDHPCRPVDAYGRIKWEVSQHALAASPPLEPIVARIFNPIGPGLSRNQAFGRFARELLDSRVDPLTMRVGNLDSRRDFVDIRDVARAMIALALRGSPRTIYNVGTGRSHRAGDGLNELIRLSGRAVRLEIDPSLGNSRGPSDSRADISRIRIDVGWEPRICWERSMADQWNALKWTREERV